jgi:tetratricopeptide (TPR) repeat protein
MDEEILEEVEQLATRMPSEELARLLERRAHGLPQGAPGRAAWLCHAGERWEMVDEFTHAKACYEQAVADGGETYLDPRADLANVLLELGETARADRLIEELDREAQDGRAHDFVHERVGEILELHDRLDEALRWYETGLENARREDPAAVDLGCLNGRFRVRRALDLPLDHYDLVCEERRRGYAAGMVEERHLLDLTVDTGPLPLTVLYWPREEFDVVLRRWPSFAETCGVDHAEHRARVELRLRELVDHDGPVAVGTASVQEFLSFAESRGDNVADPSTRGMYGAHLAYLGRVLPWPPGRDDPCWCGSGVTYATCCGALPAFSG